MFKKISYLSFIVVALFLTGCSSTMLHDNAAQLKVSAQSSLEAQIDVGDKVSGTASTMYLFNFIPLELHSYGTEGILSPNWFELLWGTYNPSKHKAAYNAVKSSNADVLVDPSYEMSYTNMILFGREKAVVSGYKGTVTGYKNVDSKNVMNIIDSRK
tara:strand:- start:972 stop:1442 length:471 start_codon:yes stop_codon:yes gene_type:complete